MFFMSRDNIFGVCFHIHVSKYIKEVPLYLMVAWIIFFLKKDQKYCLSEINKNEMFVCWYWNAVRNDLNSKVPYLSLRKHHVRKNNFVFT